MESPGLPKNPMRSCPSWPLSSFHLRQRNDEHFRLPPPPHLFWSPLTPRFSCNLQRMNNLEKLVINRSVIKAVEFAHFLKDFARKFQDLRGLPQLNQGYWSHP